MWQGYCCWVLVALVCEWAADGALAVLARSGSSAPLVRALLDNAGHVAVGVALWRAVCAVAAPGPQLGRGTLRLLRKLLRWPAVLPWMPVFSPLLLECIITALLCSALDADHFLAARSLRLYDATHLQSRPFGHAVPFAVAAGLVAAAIWRNWRVAALVWVALLSHQLRDSSRRGLWMFPFPHTRRLSLWEVRLAYVGLTLAAIAIVAATAPGASAGAGDAAQPVAIATAAAAAAAKVTTTTTKTTTIPLRTGGVIQV